MDKKAYFFILDGIAGILILMIGYMLLSTSFSETSQKLSVREVSLDMIGLFSELRLDDLCSYEDNSEKWQCDGYDELKNLLKEIDIKDDSRYLIDALGEAHKKKKDIMINKTFDEILSGSGLFREDIYGYAILIDDIILYNSIDKNIYSDLSEFKDDIGLINSYSLVPGKRYICGHYENQDGTLEFWDGIFEVWVWER